MIANKVQQKWVLKCYWYHRKTYTYEVENSFQISHVLHAFLNPWFFFIGLVKYDG